MLLDKIFHIFYVGVGFRGPGAYPSHHKVRGGVYPGQVTKFIYLFLFYYFLVLSYF